MENDLLLAKLRNYEEGSANYQQRRHEQWDENYQLFRDKVIVNRLTQRQSVNVPLMKETIKTSLSKTDDFPEIMFESLSGDEEKQIAVNEAWLDWVDKQKVEVKDIVDKKQEALYGRSFMKLNIKNKKIVVEVIEPQDILIDRYADPSDVDGTANYMCHRHIYRTMNQISLNENYDKRIISDLKIAYATSMGLKKANENFQSYQEKNQRMQSLGVWDVESPTLGETWLEVKEHYIRLKEAEVLEWWVVTTCDGNILQKRKLVDLLGLKEQTPLITWAGDVERTDIWSDGVADIVRTPNKILNSWFSQLVENRNLRNFGMNYYDSTVAEGKWFPQTYSPEPWAWIPTAGDPNKTVMRVDIPNLSDSMEDMSFVISMIERATATTSTIKGETQKSGITLGEIELATANANERISSMSKFFVPARKELAQKWYAITEANQGNLGSITLYKKSRSGKMYENVIAPEDLIDAKGYDCKIVLKADKERETMQQVEKYNAVAMRYQTNAPLQKITQRKMLDLIDLTPEEKQEVLEYEKQQAQQPQMPEMGGMPQQMPQQQPLINA